MDHDLVTRREAAGIWTTNISATVLVLTLIGLAVSAGGDSAAAHLTAVVLSGIIALVAGMTLAAGLILRYGGES